MFLRPASFLFRCSFLLTSLFVLLFSNAGAACAADSDNDVKLIDIERKLTELSFCQFRSMLDIEKTNFSSFSGDVKSELTKYRIKKVEPIGTMLDNYRAKHSDDKNTKYIESVAQKYKYYLSIIDNMIVADPVVTKEDLKQVERVKQAMNSKQLNKLFKDAAYNKANMKYAANAGILALMIDYSSRYQDNDGSVSSYLEGLSAGGGNPYGSVSKYFDEICNSSGSKPSQPDRLESKKSEVSKYVIENEIKNKIEELSFCQFSPMLLIEGAHFSSFSGDARSELIKYRTDIIYPIGKMIDSYIAKHGNDKTTERLTQRYKDYLSIINSMIEHDPVVTKKDFEQRGRMDSIMQKTCPMFPSQEYLTCSRKHINEKKQISEDDNYKKSVERYKNRRDSLSSMLRFSSKYQFDKKLAEIMFIYISAELPPFESFATDYFCKLCKNSCINRLQKKYTPKQINKVVFKTEDFFSKWKKKYCDASSRITCIFDAISIASSVVSWVIPELGKPIGLLSTFLGAMNTAATYSLCGEKINLSFTSGVSSGLYGAVSPFLENIPWQIDILVPAYECLFNKLEE